MKKTLLLSGLFLATIFLGAENSNDDKEEEEIRPPVFSIQAGGALNRVYASTDSAYMTFEGLGVNISGAIGRYFGFYYSLGLYIPQTAEIGGITTNLDRHRLRLGFDGTAGFSFQEMLGQQSLFTLGLGFHLNEFSANNSTTSSDSYSMVDFGLSATANIKFFMGKRIGLSLGCMASYSLASGVSTPTTGSEYSYRTITIQPSIGIAFRSN